MNDIRCALFALIIVCGIGVALGLGVLVEAARRPRWDETESFDDFRDALDPR